MSDKIIISSEVDLFDLADELAIIATDHQIFQFIAEIVDLHDDATLTKKIYKLLKAQHNTNKEEGLI